MGFIERENEIIKTIKSLLEAGLEFIVVGGYAASALARHRFSVDCDIVISKESLGNIQDFLKQEGFKKHVERSGFDRAYGGEFLSYTKETTEFPVTVDILVGSLVCRATGASWSFDYINKHSIEAKISGLEASVSCRIPQKELLIAFKIHSGRRADVRDVVMLRENADLEKVLNHLDRGNVEALTGQIKKIIAALEDKNLVDSLKGVFALTVDVKKQIESTRKDVDAILKAI
jgi:hypothetical protein